MRLFCWGLRPSLSRPLLPLQNLLNTNIRCQNLLILENPAAVQKCKKLHTTYYFFSLRRNFLIVQGFFSCLTFDAQHYTHKDSILYKTWKKKIWTSFFFCFDNHLSSAFENMQQFQKGRERRSFFLENNNAHCLFVISNISWLIFHQLIAL